MTSSDTRRAISILGSTGSIGTTSLDVVGRFEDRFRVVGLAAGRRVGLLKEQIERFRPSIVSVADAAEAAHLAEALGRGGPRVCHGAEGLVAVATATGTDVLVSALVGAVGLGPTLAAVDAGITVGLANKEVMVVAGQLIVAHARAAGARVLPVDSEHNAIFQALQGRRSQDVRRIVLTASGGPFRETSGPELERVTRGQALAHPTWQMGDKISIDSATLMNKGLEVIEARWFFDVESAAIDVVVHPQSIVHSMVEYRDGTVIAVLAIPDMSIPIAYALSWPDLLDLGYLPSLDLAEVGTLTFGKPDIGRFPCLRLAYDALAAGGTMPAVTNAANEVAVARFLAGDIGFTDIPRVIEGTMNDHHACSYSTVDDLLAVDGWARERASALEGHRAIA
ncbi:MAG: 1-deoxy-D-xylulose-5-phosphate reductoisomerase [Deltaproteobacteria bacterium]